FDAVKKLTAGNMVFEAVRRGMAIYSPHTAWDVADGGANDHLADILGLADRQPLRRIAGKQSQVKLVTFVPEENLAAVSQALFDAGAGRIGNYTSCSFQIKGTGTFIGQEGTNPAVGQAGRFEQVTEIRLETIVPQEKIGPVIAALRKSHPYEEPAFDLNALAAIPDGKGQGRIGTLDAAPREAILDRVKHGLGLTRLLVCGPTTGQITHAAVCAGSCGDLLDDALAAGAQLLLTGEIRHHAALKAAQRGMTVICTLHSNSERSSLRKLKSQIEKSAADLKIAISNADRDPFQIF
ncbi:MAG TPA: Nif3-like dinuclear metal center hexameric protein, partial [Tepidisphaeraceae bacterium]|nr:Nif3-like dinuclear metal center hexameric protein [Tepidisphaeraceae bacterium]